MDWIRAWLAQQQLPKLPSTAAISEALRDPKSLFALLAVVGLVLYGLSVGRTRALLSLLSIYVAYVLAILFPFLPWLTTKLPEKYQPFNTVVLFVGLYILVFWIISRSLRRSRLTLGDISLTKVAIISIVQIGLLASICLSLVSVEQGQHFAGTWYRYLGSQYALWVWAAVSLAILPFMRVHHRDD